MIFFSAQGINDEFLQLGFGSFPLFQKYLEMFLLDCLASMEQFVFLHTTLFLSVLLSLQTNKDGCAAFTVKTEALEINEADSYVTVVAKLVENGTGTGQ